MLAKNTRRPKASFYSLRIRLLILLFVGADNGAPRVDSGVPHINKMEFVEAVVWMRLQPFRNSSFFPRVATFIDVSHGGVATLDDVF